MSFNPGSFTGIAEEIKLLGLAAVVGAVLGAVFDILRVIRITFPHKSWMVFLEDFLFTLFFGGVFFCFSVEMLEGSLRLYVLAGLVAGFGAYLLTVGRIISGIFSAAAVFLEKIEKFLARKLRIVLSRKKISRKNEKIIINDLQDVP